MSKEEEEKFLELYSDSKYKKPSVTVDAVILRLAEKNVNNYRKLPEKKLQVYLKKRDYLPFKGYYSIIGNFIDLGNELSESMMLCVKNKVNLQNFYYEQLFTFGEKSRDPRTRVISTSYLLLTNQEQNLSGGEWFNIDIDLIKSEKNTFENGYILEEDVSLVFSNETTKLENILKITVKKENLKETKTVEIIKNALAFDHTKIIFYAIERLRNKLEYTDIVFNLLPKHFTLTELKNCYEVILNEKLLDANFRRKTAKLVEPTNFYETGKGHRSSQLFTHNPLWKITNLD